MIIVSELMIYVRLRICKNFVSKLNQTSAPFLVSNKMVFHDDLRAGYFNIDFNMAWFYQMLEDRGEEFLVNKKDRDGKPLMIEEVRSREKFFEDSIERAVQAFIAYKIFRGRSQRILVYNDFDLSKYDDVWEVMYDVLLEVMAKFPGFYTLTSSDSDSE